MQWVVVTVAYQKHNTTLKMDANSAAHHWRRLAWRYVQIKELTMLKMLEKLINEHGSAKILKERLGLKDDQIASLREEFNSLTEENETLKNENRGLKTSLTEAEDKIKQLKESINTDEAGPLSEIESNILQFLFNNDRYLRIEDIANFVRIDATTAKYHINNLIERKLVHNRLRVGGPATYNINKNGIKYVVENINT